MGCHDSCSHFPIHQREEGALWCRMPGEWISLPLWGSGPLPSPGSHLWSLSHWGTCAVSLKLSRQIQWMRRNYLPSLLLRESLPCPSLKAGEEWEAVLLMSVGFPDQPRVQDPLPTVDQVVKCCRCVSWDSGLQQVDQGTTWPHLGHRGVDATILLLFF